MMLPQGEIDSTRMRRSFLIVIIHENPWMGNFPLYHVDSVVRETGEKINAKRHILYVNGQNQDLSAKLGYLMHDFYSPASGGMFNAA